MTTEALKRALEKHQRWLDEHGVVEKLHQLHQHHKRAPGARRRLLKLRMAKADLRPDRDVMSRKSRLDQVAFPRRRRPTPIDTAVEPPRIVVPGRFRDLTPELQQRRCVACGAPVSWHFDGWDGTRLSCEETRRRNGEPR